MKNTSSLSLAVVIPVHEISEQLNQALDSVKKADQIILIDQTPAQNLKSRLSQINAEFYPYPRLDSFSAMKNSVKDKIKSDWTFFLDSDEQISPELWANIVAQINETDVDGFRVRRQDIFLGKPIRFGEAASVNPVRLVKTKLINWQGKAHEELVNSGKTGQLSSPLLHYPHQSISSFISKLNKYTEFLANDRESFVILRYMVFPELKFLINYVLRMGWRDGWRGFVYAFLMSLHSAMLRVKRYENYNSSSR